MKKVLLRLSCFFIASIFMFFACVAADDYKKEVETKNTYISTHNASIDKGVVTSKLTTSVSCRTGVTSVKIKMELQKSSSGVYSTVETWQQTFSGRIGSMKESKATNPFSTYRLKVTFTAYAGSASETITVYAYDN